MKTLNIMSKAFLILFSVCVAYQATSQKKDTSSKNGMKLIWSDEFNYKGLPDKTKWSYDIGGSGWGNNEAQYYTEKDTLNAIVNNGVLKIIARKQPKENKLYTSARLVTYGKKSIQYGRIEVSAKIPRGKGNWPAIWMLPDNIKTEKEGWPLCGEIDIMEHVGKNQDQIHVSLHSELYNHIKSTQVTHFDKVEGVSDAFHVYAIDWTPKYIKFYIDNKLFYEATKGQDNHVQTNEGWPFDKPYFLILNLAIGGGWGGEVDDTVFPQQMEIDYVRMYQ